MMRPITWKALRAVLAAGVLATTPQGVLTQSSAEVELRRAIETEQVKGDRKTAIQQYEKLAAGKDRAVGARALLEMARLYGAMGNADARKVYERIIKDFPEQREAVDLAQARLQGPGVGKRKELVASGGVVEFSGSVSPDGV
jgi:DNA-binding SARP family transcriptional activator